MSESILEMRQQRARVWEQMKALKERASDEKRLLDNDEQEAWDKMNTEVDDLAFTVDQAEKDERVSAVQASLEQTKNGKSPSQRTDNERFVDEVRAVLQGESKAFEVGTNPSTIMQVDQDIRSGHREERVLLTTTGGVSPGVIPISFLRTIREYQFAAAAIRQTNVTVLNTSGGESLRVPRRTALPTAAIIGEGALKTESLPTFDSVVLGSYKYANLTQVSEEFVQDEVAGVLELLARDNGLAIGNLSGQHFITGTGTGQPEGVVTALAALGGQRVITGAVGQTAGILPDVLFDIFHRPVSAYRNRATWMMNDATVAAIRKLKDTTNQYLWNPGVTTGVPDTLLGRPVITDPSVGTMAANAYSILFGDFSGYFIREVAGFRFERSDHYAFANDLITFRGVYRADGKLIDGNGLVVYRNSAT